MISKRLMVMIILVFVVFCGQLTAEEVVGESIFPNIETPHPYPKAAEDNTLVWSTIIHERGAAWIKIHFYKFRLKRGDYVDLLDMNGKVVERIMGKDVAGEHPSKFNVKNDVDKTVSFWGPAVDGNKVTVQLHSISKREKGVGFRVDKAGIDKNKTTVELHSISNTKKGMGFIINEVGIGCQPILEKDMEPIIKEDEKIDMSIVPFWRNNPRMSLMGYRGNPVDILSNPIGKMLYQKNTTWYTCKGSLNSGIGNLFYPGDTCLDSRDILDTLEVRFFLEYTTKKNIKNIPGYYTYYSDSVVEGESHHFITRIRLRNDNKMFSLDRKIGTQGDNNQDMLSGIYAAASDYQVEDEDKYAEWEEGDFVPPLTKTEDETNTVVRQYALATDCDKWYEIEMVINKDGKVKNVGMKETTSPESPTVPSYPADEISRTNCGSRSFCCWFQYMICETLQKIFWWRCLHCELWYALCYWNIGGHHCGSDFYFDIWGMYYLLCYWYGFCW